MNIDISVHLAKDFKAEAFTLTESVHKPQLLKIGDGSAYGGVTLFTNEFGLIRIREAIDKYFGDETPKAAAAPPGFEPVYFVQEAAKEAEAVT